MNNSALISALYAGIKKRSETRALIPMGYVPGIPMLTIKNDCLIAIVPFLRYKTTGEKDRTLVFPIRYVLEYSLPELTLVKFADLAVESNFSEVNFKKAIGFFRHEAIKNLDKNAYQELRQKTLSQFDKLCDMLINDKPYTENDEQELKKCLNLIVEPSLYGFYKTINIDFFNKYLMK